ncbi:hypothetical protein GCM10009716_07800 [Streptomyces sodiiphilus]|uniref:DUF3558 domain-containing protein n=1 Tax=Streptomyces sodiiphilus TaxID=226217 RepID=A0ABN2NT88_9ACTN
MSRWGVMSLTFALSILLCACSGAGQAKSYDIPSDVCGISVKPELLSPLLVAGDVLEERKSAEGGEYWKCRLLVDSKLSLVAEGGMLGGFRDPMEETAVAKRREEDVVRVRIGGEEAVLWASGAAVTFPCETSLFGSFVGVRLTTGDTEGEQKERRAHVKAFAEDFVAELKNHHQCAS